MDCGCKTDDQKQQHYGFSSEESFEQQKTESETAGYQIAGMNWWMILLFAGAIFTVLNWDEN